MFLSWEIELLGFKNTITTSAGEKIPKQTQNQNQNQQQTPKNEQKNNKKTFAKKYKIHWAARIVP